MSEDKRPDARFAMIAEELATEIKPSVIEVVVTPGLMVDQFGPPQCPRCGQASGLEPLPVIARAARVACLACPPPAPVYNLIEGVKLDTNRYRCCRCGNQPQVTAAISDINLHCRRCARLTLHAKQVDPTPSPREGWVSRSELEEARRRPSVEDVIARANAPLETFDLEDLAELAGMSWREDGASRIVGSKLEADDPLLARGFALLVRLLKLEDFDVFADRACRENAEVRGLRPRDVRRRTGRTWKGVAEALARCGIERAGTLWVKGINQNVDKELRQLTYRWRDELRLGYPNEVLPLPADRDLRGAPAGVILLVDHSYYGASRGPARVSYTP